MARAHVPVLDDSPVSAARALPIVARHLLSFLFPLNATAFLVTGPHRTLLALLFLVPVFGSVYLDHRSGPEVRQPFARMPGWPFAAILGALTLLQFLNIALLARLMSHQSFLSMDTVSCMVAVGSSSAYSGIVLGHELIHRPNRFAQTLGRLVFVTVLYEHFFTEHVRGHHVRVGTPEDPATARFGETFVRFYFRTVPAQFRSAWRLETTRLGDPDMPLYDLRLLRSRVVHGIAAEVLLLVAITHFAGWTALAVFLMQAWWATRALEVVNYFEHWGLSRTTRSVEPMHSWDTHSRFTYYALTGLSRHADHHAFASRPYQQLRVWEESPKLPKGYLAMFPLVLGRNRRFQELMTEELRQKHLGPFTEGART